LARQYIIIGNGAAGLSAAEAIRARDGQGRITIITDEPLPFYSRPGLAYYLRGDLPEKQLFSRPRDYYEQQRFEVITGRATKLDPDSKTVTIAGSHRLSYDRLLIATGSRAVKPAMPGIDLQGVVTLDNMADVQSILRLTKKARRAVVVGGGITALEMVEGLQVRGVETHYLLRKDRFWSNLLDESESRLVEDRLREHDIAIYRREELAEIQGKKGRVHAVRTKAGRTLPCDMVGVAIGVRPNLDLIADTTIARDRGILVDDHLRSSVPDVYAAGDVAQVLDRWSGEYKLDVLWPTALATGRVAGANMAGAHEHFLKGPPFNAALLCGLHLTIIGQAAADPRIGTGDDLVGISRGSSEVWFSRTSEDYAIISWRQPEGSQRIVVRGPAIVGALLLGDDQTLADPLRDLISGEADTSPIRQRLFSEHDTPLTDIVQPFWETWKKANRPNEERREA